MLISMLVNACITYFIESYRRIGQERKDTAKVCSLSPKELFPNDLNPEVYFYYTRSKKWNELSSYDQGLMTRAAQIILAERGIAASLSEIEAYLKPHLPEVPKHTFDYSMLYMASVNGN